MNFRLLVLSLVRGYAVVVFLSSLRIIQLIPSLELVALSSHDSARKLATGLLVQLAGTWIIAGLTWIFAQNIVDAILTNRATAKIIGLRIAGLTFVAKALASLPVTAYFVWYFDEVPIGRLVLLGATDVNIVGLIVGLLVGLGMFYEHFKLMFSER